jgi:hypothetical protein
MTLCASRLHRSRVAGQPVLRIGLCAAAMFHSACGGTTATPQSTTTATVSSGGHPGCVPSLTFSQAVTGHLGAGAVASITTGAEAAQVSAHGTADSLTIALVANGGPSGVSVSMQVQPGSQAFSANVTSNDVELSSNGRVATFHHVILSGASGSATVDGTVTCPA